MQESDSDSELSVVEDSGEDMSPVVRPQAQQQKQKRVQFDENLNIRVYLAGQEELHSKSASDSDDSDGSDDSDDAPRTPPAPIIDDTSLLGQPDHVRNDKLSERATLLSEPDEMDDFHFGFSFETKKHQSVHNQTLTESESVDDSEQVSDDSQDTDIALGSKKQSSSKQQSILLPAEVEPASSSDAEDFSGDHPNDPIADDICGYDHMEVGLCDPGGQSQHSSTAAALDESDEEATDAKFETRHLTETANCRQSQDGLQQGQRKSQRMKFRPLAYHMGERVHYHRSAAVRTV